MALFSQLNRSKFKDRLGFIHEAHPFQIYFWALIVGIISSFATIGFIKFYELLIRFFYFSPTTNFTEIATFIPLWVLLCHLSRGRIAHWSIYLLLCSSTRPWPWRPPCFVLL